MQSIVLVCRSWYGVGVIFLYENICIRRCHQLESLRWTLTSSPAKHLSLLVKSLTIQCCIPKSRAVNIGTDLELIMGCCTSLSTFAYNARFVPPAGVMSISFPTYITHFRLEGDFDYDQLFLILIQLKNTLLSFHLMIWDYNFERSVNSQDLRSRLNLPLLQSLSLTILSSEKSNALNLLRTHLSMPSLQRLTVAGYDLFHSSSDLCDWELLSSIFLFLESHGGHLRQLHINGFRFTPEAFIQILTFCPRLERVILHPSTFLHGYWSDSDEFYHPNLRWIDFAHYLRDRDVYRSSELRLSKKNLPALERVRRFCNFPGGMLNWLDEYPPNAEAETEEFVIDVFRHQLGCREGLFVWRFERDVLEDNEKGGRFSGSFTVWEDGNTDSDSDYIPTYSDRWDSSSSEDLDCEETTPLKVRKLPPWR